MAAGTERRRAAILSADVVGYSRLMGADEAGTLEALRMHRAELIDDAVARHGGRIVKTMGDGLLIEFSDAAQSVRCALAVQDGMASRNLAAADDKKVVYRIGINYSDIILEGGDIFGDGVNIAARLEGFAEPGGLLVSQSVYERVAGELQYLFADSGPRKFKNIVQPVQVWSWPRRLPDEREDRKPFVMLGEFAGAEGGEAELAADLKAELSAELSRLTGLEVTLDARKADYAVVASVRRAGGRSRISASLVAVEENKQLWAERYQPESGDAFGILDECVPKMVMSLRRRIAADDGERASGKDPGDMTVEQMLAAAGRSFFTPTMAGWSGAGEIAERAVEKAPENFMALAMAAAGLGLAEALYGFRPTEPAVIDRAMRHIEEARRQTNESDMVLTVYSGLLLYGRGRHDEARAAAEAALQLNPGYNMALWNNSAAEIFSGQYEAGIETGHRAINIDTRDPYVHLYSRTVAYGHFAAGGHEEAARWFWRADQLAPGLPHNLAGLAASQAAAGDGPAAAESLSRLIEAEPAFCMRDMAVPPFRASDIGERYAAHLRAAGAPEANGA